MEDKEEIKTISKELTWKGLRMELSLDGLQNICQQNYELDQYYDFDLLINGLYKTLNKEIDFDYFSTWCVLIANCFNYTNYKKQSINSLMYDISFFFDGIAFDDEWDEKKLYAQIAALKDYNHTFQNKLYSKKSPFETNGIERILVFDHANWTLDSGVYRVIIKNNNTKEFDLKYVDEADFVYDDKINYTFVNDKKFDEIFNSFYDENAGWKENHKLQF